MLAKLSVLA